MFRQVKLWKNFLNFLPQMSNSSSIVALAGNVKVLPKVGHSTTNVEQTTKVK